MAAGLRKKPSGASGFMALVLGSSTMPSMFTWAMCTPCSIGQMATLHMPHALLTGLPFSGVTCKAPFFAIADSTALQIEAKLLCKPCRAACLCSYTCMPDAFNPVLALQKHL